mgnify:FL=1
MGLPNPLPTTPPSLPPGPTAWRGIHTNAAERQKDRDMLVETYECTETAAEPIEATEEAVAIMESLGLEGQLESSKPDANGNATRCPYRVMTADEQFAYGVLCPTVSPIEKYKASPIPLRVLQLAAHAKSLDMFEGLVVWDRAEAAIPDPVLVGVAPDGEYTWMKKNYILARWGEQLDAFVTILATALEVKRKEANDIAVSAYKKLAHVADDGISLTDAELIRKGASWKPSLTID